MYRFFRGSVGNLFASFIQEVTFAFQNLDCNLNEEKL